MLIIRSIIIRSFLQRPLVRTLERNQIKHVFWWYRTRDCPTETVASLFGGYFVAVVFSKWERERRDDGWEVPGFWHLFTKHNKSYFNQCFDYEWRRFCKYFPLWNEVKIHCFLCVWNYRYIFYCHGNLNLWFPEQESTCCPPFHRVSINFSIII